MNATDGDKVTSVLVLDDDEEVRTALVRRIVALGSRCVSVATPLALIRLLEFETQRFDVALIDWRLGCASDGLDVIEYLADAHPAIRRVFMSGSIAAWPHEDETIRVHAFLPKPWTDTQLCDALRV